MQSETACLGCKQDKTISNSAAYYLRPRTTIRPVRSDAVEDRATITTPEGEK